MTARSTALISILVAGIPVTGCHKSPTAPLYNPQIPSSWASSVTNAYLPLVPGTTYQYRGQTSAGVETITVEVLPGSQMVNGVAATVVRDRVYVNGTLIEDTIDWYAQDGAGNVWYLGEQVKNIVNGQVVDTAGSWKWGVDGALPGIFMWAAPAAHVGEAYRQEFYRGKAEDWGKVVTLNQSVTVPYGSFSGCITIEDWVGLKPADPHALKTYCPQVGQTRETHVGSADPPVQLISRTP